LVGWSLVADVLVETFYVSSGWYRHHAELQHKAAVYSVSEKFYPQGFSENFSQRLRIFKQNLTRLLYVSIYGKLQSFIQSSLNLTKLCLTAEP